MSSCFYDDLCKAGRVGLPIAAARGTVFSLLFGPPAEDQAAKAAQPKYLIAGTNSGRIAIYHVPDVLQKSMHAGASGDPIAPSIEWTAHQGAVYAMRFAGAGNHAMLLSGGDDGRINGWAWSTVEAAMAAGRTPVHKPPTATFQFQVPQQRGPGGSMGPIAEVNDLACDDLHGRLFAAAGDGCAYAWDMSTGQLASTFAGGHSDMLHTIALRPAHRQVVTGCEDGTCVVWDVRSRSHAKLLDLSRTSGASLPFSKSGTVASIKATPAGSARPIAVANTGGSGATSGVPGANRALDAGAAPDPRGSLQGGHWVGAMATDTSQDWLFIGAGSTTSSGGALVACSMHAMAPVTAVVTDAPVHALAYSTDQQVLAGGAGPLLRAYGGVSLASQHVWKTSASSIFAVTEHTSKLVAVGGRGGLVDIFTDYGSLMATLPCS